MVVAPTHSQLSRPMPSGPYICMAPPPTEDITRYGGYKKGGGFRKATLASHTFQPQAAWTLDDYDDTPDDDADDDDTDPARSVLR